MVIKQFIKKKPGVSQTAWEIMPYLKNIFEKNKKSFGNLLDTLNYYLIYGKDVIGADQVKIQFFIDIANDSLNSTCPSINVHNSEGAILLQVLF